MEKINKKILIMEDDKSYLWILRQGFESAGFSVVFAQDGEDGLKMIAEEKPDLVMLDIIMPKMDGIEVARQMKEGGINIPKMFLTNMSDADHMSRAIETKPSDYIIKSDVPVDQIVARVKDKLGVK